jgi:hypothetical protein
MKTTKQQLNDFLTSGGRGWRGKPRIICKDGWSMSVQASQHHYCRPRQDVGPWTEVEVGYPSTAEPLLFEYVECETDDTDWTGSVYPYTPVGVVAAVLDLHGGVDWEVLKDSILNPL